jgi:hypothetical protein
MAVAVAALGTELRVRALVGGQVAAVAVITRYKRPVRAILHQLLPLKALTVVLMAVMT